LSQFGDWRDVPALGNPVIGNTNVLKRLTVPRGLFTQSIRIQVSDTPDKWCRITEVEAWGYWTGHSRHHYGWIGALLLAKMGLVRCRVRYHHAADWKYRL